MLSLTLSPVLSSYLLKGGHEHDTLFLRMLKTPLQRRAGLGDASTRRKRSSIALLLFVGVDLALPFPRHVVHPRAEGRNDLTKHGSRSEHFAR